MIAFGVGLPAYTNWAESGGGTECGSVLMPNFVSTFSSGACEDTLMPPRIATLSLSAVAALGARVSAVKSRSVGRSHTAAWDASLVVGVFATFLFVWTVAAYLLANLGAYEPS